MAKLTGKKKAQLVAVGAYHKLKPKVAKQVVTHYFDEDGNYGSTDGILMFDTSDWTERDWEIIAESADNDRVYVAKAIHSRHIKLGKEYADYTDEEYERLLSTDWKNE